VKSPRLLLISVGVNVLLLLVLCWQTIRLQQSDMQFEPALPVASRDDGPLLSQSGEPAPQTSVFPPPTRYSSGSTQPAFHWRQLESTNYQTYINNLLAAGCPEQTVRDIITADVNANFATRRAEVMAGHFQNYKFWETGSKPDAVKTELKRQQDSVDTEMGQVLRDLLGPDAAPPSMTRDWHIAELDQELSFLSPDKRDAALALLLRNEANDALIKRLSEAHRPTEDARELNRILQTYEGKRSELARLLAPEEFEQLELTVSWTADNLRRGMAKFDPTEAEFREIFRAWRLHDQNLAQLYATGQPDPGNGHVFAAIRQALGEERYRQYRATWWK